MNHSRSYSLLFVLVLALVILSSANLSHAWFPLNDTGIQFCGEADSGNNFPCTGTEPKGQDAHYGRDALASSGLLHKIGSGMAGFDFTKISNRGNQLHKEAKLGIDPDNWGCTLDNVTGLMWEVKLNNSINIRHKEHKYTWYFSDSSYGGTGIVGNTSSCNYTLGILNCNTENYVSTINSFGLCGFNDWRLPTRRELESIVNYGKFDPTIDTEYFPNTSSWWYWSSSPYADWPAYSWSINFHYGGSNGGGTTRSQGCNIRLVRKYN